MCQFKITSSGFERLEESGALLKLFSSWMFTTCGMQGKLEAVLQTQRHMPVTRKDFISVPDFLATTPGEDFGDEICKGPLLHKLRRAQQAILSQGDIGAIDQALPALDEVH